MEAKQKAKRSGGKDEIPCVLKNVEIPLTIVECGFLSNEQEEQQLQDDKYQDKLAWGIYNGIINYFYE